MAKTVEKTRTTVGYNLLQELDQKGLGRDEAIWEVVRRVRVRVVRTWADGDFGEIETSLDGGEWVNEGTYSLS